MLFSNIETRTSKLASATGAKVTSSDQGFQLLLFVLIRYWRKMPGSVSLSNIWSIEYYWTLKIFIRFQSFDPLKLWPWPCIQNDLVQRRRTLKCTYDICCGDCWGYMLILFPTAGYEDEKYPSKWRKTCVQ